MNENLATEMCAQIDRVARIRKKLFEYTDNFAFFENQITGDLPVRTTINLINRG